MRKILLAGVAALAVAPLLSSCVAPAVQSFDSAALPGNDGWYDERQASGYVPPPSPPVAATQPEPATADAGPQSATVTGGALPQPGSGTVHDLTAAAGGYVIGRQAEHLVRQTINRRRLAAAGEGAAEIGAGAAATRAATGRALTAGGAAAAEGEGAAAAGAALRGGAGVAGEALTGETLVEGGLALGAGEVATGVAIAAGAAWLGYEGYQYLQHHSDQQKAGQ